MATKRFVSHWVGFCILILVAGATLLAFHHAQKSKAQILKGMVLIPGGTFTMGSNENTSMPNEGPAHRVHIDGFYIDDHLVTNVEFAHFVEQTGYVTTAEKQIEWDELKKQLPPGTPKIEDDKLVPGALVFIPPPGPVPLDNLQAWWRWVPGVSWRHPEGPLSDLDGRQEHPVVQVSWFDAQAYAKWLGKRLPSEAEWEYAARGGLEGKRFPWGDEFRPNGRHMANTFQGVFPYQAFAEDGFLGTSPVKHYPPNAYGLYDMVGNVWEWTADWYRPDFHQQNSHAKSCKNPTGPSSSFDPHAPFAPSRVIKGGSFLCHVDYCEGYRPSARRAQTPDTGTSHIGFRLALDRN